MGRVEFGNWLGQLGDDNKDQESVMGITRRHWSPGGPTGDQEGVEGTRKVLWGLGEDGRDQ